MIIKLILFTIGLSFSISSNVMADESNVYRCRFEDSSLSESIVRMKKYYDTSQKVYLGKVDLLESFYEKESIPTKVYQIPLQNGQSYMQIWYAQNLRVDAQLSYTQGIREFHATYNKNAQKLNLVCTELKN